ncbi:hypothetical protein [Pseudomonas sp. PDM25]|uniref:hypothetical protein n=1 Tax=Pseudomonas sp. PDM25 TaxID=2854772 RepID=UPI001C455471|nr:hypothetical protein [Pseudomonas sp. PDM25]MBV7510081.1 hypothetical protein [Pseudomonas sp. PDM25]
MSYYRACLASLILLVPYCTNAHEENWAPREGCDLSRPHPGGLYPDAAAELANLGLSARITQALNTAKKAENVHGADKTINGILYTGAVDISIRCLKGEEDDQIKRILTALSANGFVAWYRKNGTDGWNGANHIHAVWVRQPLKPVLERQVESWLAFKNGLKSDKDYTFWKPTDDLLEKIKNYRADAF